MTLIVRMLIVAFLVAACDRAGTEPLVERPVHPLVGTYDVRTVLDSFSFETAGQSTRECPTASLYCTHYRTTVAGASLSGTITIVDSATEGPLEASRLYATGLLGGRFCSAIDLSTGCTAVGDSVMRVHDHGGVGLTTTFATDSAFVLSLSTDTSWPRVTLSPARLSGDSLYGRLLWNLGVARSPPTYYGSFVAHRRR